MMRVQFPSIPPARKRNIIRDAYGIVITVEGAEKWATAVYVHGVMESTGVS